MATKKDWLLSLTEVTQSLRVATMLTYSNMWDGEVALKIRLWSYGSRRGNVQMGKL